MTATKDEIAGAFNELAARYGFRRTSINDVARALRISEKTIYRSYSSKEELLRCAIELSAGEQCRRVEAALTETTAVDQLQQVATMALADARRFYEANPRADLMEPSEVLAEVNAEVLGRLLATLLAEGVTAGEFEVADTPSTYLPERHRHGGSADHPRRTIAPAQKRRCSNAVRRLLVKGRGPANDDHVATPPS